MACINPMNNSGVVRFVVFEITHLSIHPTGSKKNVYCALSTDQAGDVSLSRGGRPDWRMVAASPKPVLLAAKLLGCKKFHISPSLIKVNFADCLGQTSIHIDIYVIAQYLDVL